MIQCEGCYFQKENVCCHENPFFDIDDVCTNYVEKELINKIKTDTIDEVLNLKHYAFQEDDDNMYIRVSDIKKVKGENNQ